MQIIDLALPDVKLVQLKVHGDARGFFIETYRKADWQPILGERSFVQDNQSLSGAAGTVRGLHYQLPPFAQGKLVQALRGRILDVAVDLRVSSPTFGKAFTIELSVENKTQLFVPIGFAHGFATLSEYCEVQYKQTEFYRPETEGGIAWNDPDVGIAWPYANPTLSKRDQAQRSLKAYRENPAFE